MKAHHSEPRASVRGSRGISPPRLKEPLDTGESDQRVLDRIRRSPSGAGGVDIARAALGWKAKRHTMASLDLIGLSIAARLVGAGLIRATRSNRFKAATEDAA